MNKYQRGKIYKIVGSNHNKIYVGSTISTLSQRLHQHKINKKQCSSKLLLNDDKVEILLIKDFPCDSNKELRIRERYFWEKLDCINTKCPYETPEEKRLRNIERNKKYVRKPDVAIKRKEKQKRYDDYRTSWGGNKRYNNNLLEINVIGDLQ